MDRSISNEVKAALSMIEVDEKALLETTLRMMKAYDGAVYTFDLFANGALNRAVALSSGFRSLIESRNLICAGAILRLQLDTAARFAAGFIVENHDEFAADVLKGERIDKMADQDGHKMTDRNLVKSLANEYPWVEKLYEETSGYVHFSGTHLASVFDGANRKESKVQIKVGEVDRSFSDEVYLSAIKTFRDLTAILIRYVEGWTIKKEDAALTEASKMLRNESSSRA